jgi:tetratricopeptide (TPR) repeat protein
MNQESREKRLRPTRLATAILSLVILAACSKSAPELAAEALNRGLELHRKGEVTAAARAYREVLVHDPNNKGAFYNLGLIDQQSGRSGSAERNYRQALDFDPDFLPGLFNLAIILTKTNPEEAEGLYRHLLELNPDDSVAHLNLGFLLIDLGKTDEGRAELEKAVELDPKLKSRIPPTPEPAPEAEPVESPQPRSPQPASTR